MTLSGEEIRHRLEDLVSDWTGYQGSERSEAQTFLNRLLHCFGTDRKAVGARFEETTPSGGAQPADVVQTRMYVTDINHWEEIGCAHAEAFGAIRPVTAMVEVARLIDPRMLVEIEAVAYLAGGGAPTQ